MTIHFRLHYLFAALVVLAAAPATAPAAAARLFDKAEYASRRQKLMEKIPDGVAIIFGARPIASYYRYSQSNDFMYLTGVGLPDAALIIDGQARSSTLLFTSTEAAVPIRPSTG